MHLSASDIMIVYVLSAFGALAFLVWLGVQVLKLLRAPNIVPEPPEE